jgi:catechol 2,3-dioxygenase-like lactoylglutathione lyase family enzyme
MPSAFDLVTIDAPDTDAIARFWSAALGLHELEREDVDRWIVLADVDGVRRLGIQRGDTRPGSMHLDLVCEPGDFDSEIERLVRLGARLAAPAAPRGVRLDRQPRGPRRQPVRPLLLRVTRNGGRSLSVPRSVRRRLR